MIHDDRILQSAYSVVMPVQSYSRKCRLASRKLQVGVLKGEKLQFTRTIRKSASSMLSAASQLFLLIKWRSVRIFVSSDSQASMNSELGKLRVKRKIKIEPDIDS